MKILVIGSGAREHALVWKIAQSPLVEEIFCAPGNAGISQQAECVDIKADDIYGLISFVKKKKIDLTVVGPEIPLSLGIADEFAKAKAAIFGPLRKAAQIESSKVFAKEIMRKYDVPTAGFEIFDDCAKAHRYIEQIGTPCVIKADGLAAGKGVVIPETVEDAKDALQSIMCKKVFGEAGNKVIIEECLTGEEASILVITDSKGVVALASSQDHKRIFDNDKGPNTGGMGAYSPAPVITGELFKEILDTVIYRTIRGLANEGIKYKGVLYAGIMVTKEGPRVLEFNVRFGDPETQAILPRMKFDLVEMMMAVVEDRLTEMAVNKSFLWDSRASVCVVLASGGYPGNYQKNKAIHGLEDVSKMRDIVVFHAGTKKTEVQPLDVPKSASSQGFPEYLTSGGRVLGVTGLGDTIKEAIDKTYQAVEKISFDGMHYRRDIGHRAL